MAKTELKLIDYLDDQDFIKTSLGVVKDRYGRGDKEVIYLEGISYGSGFCICLDKSTAIKFSKTVRTEINKIKEEGSNG